MFQTNLYFHVNKVFDLKLFNAVSVNNIKWQNEFLNTDISQVVGAELNSFVLE